MTTFPSHLNQQEKEKAQKKDKPTDIEEYTIETYHNTQSCYSCGSSEIVEYKYNKKRKDISPNVSVYGVAEEQLRNISEKYSKPYKVGC